MIRSLIFTTLATVALPSATAQALLKDLSAGSRGSGGYHFTSVGGVVVFKAHTPATGGELFRTDGTAAGTRVLDLNPGTASGIDDSNLVSMREQVLFLGTDGTQSGLCRTDGTSAGTRFVAPLTSGGLPLQYARSIFSAGDVAYISGQDATNFMPVLYRTDGTAAGTRVVRAFPGYQGPASPRAMAGGQLIFMIGTSTQIELWATDGTSTGTRRLQTAPATNGLFENFTEVDGRAYFVQRRVNPSPIWVTDGTPGGTRIATTLGGRHGHRLGTIGDRLLALAIASGDTLELWRVDAGNPGGTFVATLRSGVPSISAWMVSADDVAYVTHTRYRGHVPGYSECWRTDGTAAGTQLFLPTSRGVTVSSPFPIGNHLVFTGWDAFLGREPWVTDGTSAGTRNLIDISPGRDVSNPISYGVGADLARDPMLFFSAYDRANGTEPRVLPMSAVGAAAYLPVRRGCSNNSPAPRLARTGGQPLLGNGAFGLEIRALPNQVAALLVDPQIGATVSGCATLFNPAILLMVRTNASGTFRIPAPVPTNQALIGRRVYAQGLTASAGGALLGSFDSTDLQAIILGQ